MEIETGVRTASGSDRVSPPVAMNAAISTIVLAASGAANKA
jgi:hypothetical protein